VYTAGPDEVRLPVGLLLLAVPSGTMVLLSVKSASHAVLDTSQPCIVAAVGGLASLSVSDTRMNWFSRYA